MDVQWLRALAVRGDLPNLARFIVSAQGAEVRSDGGTLHGPVWPTFAPGAGPGHHGRYWWMQWLPQDMRYVRSSHPAFAYDPFWLGIAEAGRRVVVLDVPYAPLVRHPLVEQITGWGSHDGVEEESWPGGARRRLERIFGRHPLTMDTVEPHTPRELVRMAYALLGLVPPGRFAGRRVVPVV